jgi:NADP-dependent 3-hydroxy acid dehydrogenase YdfG
MHDHVTTAPGGAPVRPATLAALARYAAALDGQATLVTGAASGIGRAIAVALAGADVALVGRREASLRETAAFVRPAGRRAVEIPAAVAD